MAYSVGTYSGSRTLIVEDGTIDSSLDLRLIGKNYAGYGEVQNENFVHLLENFASAVSPPRPMDGQIWYDTGNKKLKFYDSTSTKWKSTGGAESNTAAPAGMATGDLWWDATNKQLYAYDSQTNPQFVLVGPQAVPGLGTTQVKSITVLDSSRVIRAVIAAYVNGKIVYFISSETDQYTLHADSINQLGIQSFFSIIHPGLTLANTGVTGITEANTSNFWGTASNSLKLGGLSVSDFVQVGNLSFDGVVHFSDAGYTVGASNDIEVKILDGNAPIFTSVLGAPIKFYIGENLPLTLVGAHILPGASNTTDLGSLTSAFRSIYVDTIHTGTLTGNGSAITNLNAAALTTGVLPRVRLGLAETKATNVYDISITGSAASVTGNVSTATTAENANKLQLGSSYVMSSIDTAGFGTGNTIVARDSGGNVNAVFFQGTATAALFADLAEKYLADDIYEVGTVVAVGGTAEVTACKSGDRAFGAVSANPAFRMNEGLEGGTYIALKGRVPVKTIGPIVKGDKLIAVGNGCAGNAAIYLKNMTVRAGTFPDTFAIALETNNNPDIKLVEAIIL